MKKCAWPLTAMAWGLAGLLSCGVFAQDKPAGNAGKLPTAKEVLETYIESIGGKKAFAEYDSQHARGTIEMSAQKLKGSMEVFAARPNKLLVVMDMPGVGEITTGFDGKIGWMNNPLTGPMLLPENMLEQIATQADFDHALRRPEDYKTMEMLGIEQFGGESCYKLKLVHRTGFESTEFFSKETGLQKGFFSTQASPFGEVNVTTEITDYKKFGNILMPSRIAQKVSGMEQVITLEEMEFNTVPDSKFVLPPEVKALAGSPSAEQPQEGAGKSVQPAVKPAPAD